MLLDDASLPLKDAYGTADDIDFDHLAAGGLVDDLDAVASQAAEELTRQAREPTARQLARLACQLYDARRARDRLLNPKLLGEPGWDILLALYCLPTRGEILGISSLAHCAGVPATTGLRWEAVLRNNGLIERGPHVTDRRLQLVRLTAEGKALMERYLSRLYYCSTPAPPFPERAGGALPFASLPTGDVPPAEGRDED